MQVIVMHVKPDTKRQHIHNVGTSLVKAKHGTVIVCPDDIELEVLEIDTDEEYPRVLLTRDDQQHYRLEYEDEPTG